MNSDVWQYFGEASNPSFPNCVSGFGVSPNPASGPGQFRNVPSAAANCLQRSANINSAMTDAVVINNIYNAKDFVTFQGDDTTDYHAMGHFIFGGSGDMGNPSYSPNDPMFYCKFQ